MCDVIDTSAIAKVILSHIEIIVNKIICLVAIKNIYIYIKYPNYFR